MSSLLILGAGQYGTVVKEVAQAIGSYTTISFLDDNNPRAIGRLADYVEYVGEYDHAFVAIGNLSLRLEWICRLQSAGFVLPVLVHPRAVVMPSAKIGAASVIEPLAVVHSYAVVGDGCIISSGAIVNHNAEIDCCCHVDCNAVVPANEIVPPQTKVLYGTVYHSALEERNNVQKIY